MTIRNRTAAMLLWSPGLHGRNSTNRIRLEPSMNTKSLLITIAVAFVTVWATDFLIHAVWLGATYKETALLWRPEAELMSVSIQPIAGSWRVGRDTSASGTRVSHVSD